MFSRFTSAARASIVRAQEESLALGDDSVASEHLLLGLATDGDDTVRGVLGALGVDADALRAALRRRDPDGLDADALATIGIDLEAVRRSVEESFGPGALSAGSGGERGSAGRHRPFTADSKRALERALREATELRAGELRPEHLLLGVAADRNGAAAALQRCGTSAEAVRAATLSALRGAT